METKCKCKEGVRAEPHTRGKKWKEWESNGVRSLVSFDRASESSGMRLERLIKIEQIIYIYQVHAAPCPQLVAAAAV